MRCQSHHSQYLPANRRHGDVVFVNLQAYYTEYDEKGTGEVE